MSATIIKIQEALPEDVEATYLLAKELATSFKVEKEAFLSSYQRILNENSALILVVKDLETPIGYCLGFMHNSFYANGPIAWVEELFVLESHRKANIGRQLMNNFEDWAQSKNASLIALATRRAEPFYEAIGYEKSETYLRKLLS